MVNKINIKEAIEKKVLFIDARTPKEYNEDHILDALNMPILDDEERHSVGLAYKTCQDTAFDMGIEYYSKKLPHLVEDVKKLPKDRPVVIYCWRGGMRSKAITQLVDLLGYEAYQLSGGYKKYREYLRKELYDYEADFKFIVLHGLAGSGKTDLIKILPNSLDLEGLARHRSSIFGAIGLEPVSQKRFEGELLRKLREFEDLKCKYVFVEGESQKIGDIFLTNAIFKAMKKGIKVRTNATIETRAKRIVRDYFTHGEDDLIIKLINTLRQAMTNEVCDDLIERVKKKEYEFVSQVLLEKYYDAKYEHGLASLNYDKVIDIDNIEEAKEKLISFLEELYEQQEA